MTRGKILLGKAIAWGLMVGFGLIVWGLVGLGVWLLARVLS